MRKKILSTIILVNLFVFSSASYCFGQIESLGKTDKGIRDQTEAFRGKSGYELVAEEGVPNVIAVAIKAFLSVLGIIFVVLIVVAGYNWMTASGNEEKVEKAKDTIKRAIIGLIITASAYAITTFVFSKL